MRGKQTVATTKTGWCIDAFHDQCPVEVNHGDTTRRCGCPCHQA